MDADRIRRLALFGALAEPDLATVAAAATELDVAAGTAVASEDDFGHALFAIESGAVDIVQDGVAVRRLVAGDVFGEIALLRSGRRTASAIAADDCRLLTWFKRDVWQLERTAPSFAEALRASAEARLSADGASDA